MNFNTKVYEAVNKIPPGRVTSYGHIALLVGSPRAARQVGWALAGLPEKYKNTPWWRVINKQGFLSIRNDDILAKLEQKSLLEAEGVQVDDTKLTVNMEMYGWYETSA